jgi:hypothetical protein
MLLIVPVSVAILSSATYHSGQTSTPVAANPAVTVLATYPVAFLLTWSLPYYVPDRQRLMQ